MSGRSQFLRKMKSVQKRWQKEGMKRNAHSQELLKSFFYHLAVVFWSSLFSIINFISGGTSFEFEKCRERHFLPLV